MKNILTLTLLSSLLCASSYAQCTRNSNETVSCSDSKLMWQDDKSAKTVKKKWIVTIKHCEDLTFAGYSDWRLPNKNELLSIVDRSKYSPAINGVFQNTVSYSYWSSTSYSKSIGDGAWLVHFINGAPNINDGKFRSNYVRCVRAGQ